jgi:hypothetical protein
MTLIKSIFWNSDQRRPRALWRLIAQLIIWVLVEIPVQILFGLVIVRDAATAAGPLMSTVNVIMSGLTLTLSIWLAGRFLDRRRFVDFGFHLNQAWWRDLGFGLALGAVLMTSIFLIELAAGWVTVSGTFVTRDPEVGFLSTILRPLIVFLAVGIYEELLSRGYHLRNMAEGLRRLGAPVAIAAATAASSAIFGVLHAANPNASLFSTLNIVIAGVLLALGCLLTGELAIPIGLHITWNFFQGNVFGFPVSGGDFRAATFIAVEQGGPDLWTGGAFGPEAGLLGLIAMALGVALTILWVRLRHGEARLHLALAEPPEQAMAQAEPDTEQN